MEFITASEFYKSLFGSKVYKICLDSGCTCPNRDGSKGSGGCYFCSTSGSGDFTADRSLPIQLQVQQAKMLVDSKFPKGATKKYLVYFQNFTNTYGDINHLKQLWMQALSCDEIVGLCIATRPDCISNEVLKILNELSQEYFIQLELGLQTCNEKTAQEFNRCYLNADYESGMAEIKSICPRVHVVTHLIFGLPGDSEEDMLASVRFAIKNKTDGIKISVLYVLKGTEYCKRFLNNEFEVLEMDEYLRILSEALKIIPETTVIHRLTGDPPKSIIEAPLWTCDKKKVLNQIKKLLGKN